MEAIEKIKTAFDSGKKYVFLDAPTGAGKSALGITIARLYNNAFYITSSKILQDQLMRDFSSIGVIDLKGRNAYECVAYDVFPQIKAMKNKPYVSCAEGFCKKEGRPSCDMCVIAKPIVCPYFQQLELAKTSKITVMNFSSFFFQTLNSGQKDADGKERARFPSRSLMIIDEAHNTEGQIMSFVSLSLLDSSFDGEKRIPSSGTTADYAAWIKKEKIQDFITMRREAAIKEEDIASADQWEHLNYKVSRFLDANPSEWVSEYSIISKEYNLGKVELKPIFAKRHAFKYLFNKADRFLLMSATIVSPDQMCESLGIDPNDMEYIEMPSRFPVENRPIFFDSSVGSMSFRNRDQTMPNLLKKIEEICEDHHPDHRGIIHTHSFMIADYIAQNASPKLKQRLHYQKDYQFREDSLRALELSENGILIGPAWHEGLDLKDDMGRFAIICKVPYPNYTTDPQLKARMEISHDYYDYITALKLVQSYGRTVRTETDWALTYILDRDFDRFMKKCNHLLPKWFTEAVEGV